MGNTLSQEPRAPCSLPFTRMCFTQRCKAARREPEPPNDITDNMFRATAVPLGCAIASGICVSTWAKATATPPILRAGLAGAAVCIPLGVAVDSAIPVVKRKMAEAAEAEKQPLPDGVVPSGWYNFTIVLRVVNWALEDWQLWGGTYGIVILQTLASSAMPGATTGALQALVTPGADVPHMLCQLSGVLMASATLNALKGVAMQEALTRLVVRIQRRALRNVMQQETHFFDTHTSTAIFTELGHVGGLKAVVGDFLPALVATGVRLTTTLYLLTRYDTTLAAICLLSVPADYVLTQWQNRMVMHYTTQSETMMKECRHLAQEMVQGYKTSKTHHAVDEQIETFWQSNEGLLSLLREQSWQLAFASLVNTAVPHLTSVVIFGYASYLAQLGRLETTHLLTVALHQASLASAFQGLAVTYGKYGILMAQCAKGFRFLARQPKQNPRGTYQPGKNWTGAIQLEKVSFRYSPDGNEVLRNFSLNVHAGECVALVGPSGGGKTTILNLILALYDTTEGCVRVDGRPVAEYDPLWYYGRGVAVVPQCPILLKGSVRDNIAFGLAETLTLEQVETAAEQANAMEFIQQMEGGFDAEVGKGGEKLSGGQRQRIAIARALVRNPGILLLDEATSALDAKAEHLVQEALHRAMKGRTVVVVAHRLSTIKKADRIVMVDRGQVVEEGKYEELLEAGGPFAKLVRTQLVLDESS